jgi:hypothetical protein
MTDTFRALCEELIGIWAVKSELRFSEFWDKLADIDGRARAALAQLEPQGPSDEELDAIWAQRAFCTDGGVFGLGLEEFRDITHAVLARWGCPAIESVPKREDVHYAWELHDAEGEWQAGGFANSLEDVQRAGNRYLQTYLQDGPHKLIIERHCVTTIEPVPGVEVE